jgi:VWFA-related protein
MTSKLARALLLLLSTLLTSVAQSPQTSPTPQAPVQTPVKADQDDVVKITTNLVQVDAVVTKDGKPVRDLRAEDFEIYEDGKRQEISSFAYISNVPRQSTTPGSISRSGNASAPPAPTRPLRPNDPRRVIALVVDDLGLSAESMGSVRKQLRKFIDQQLSPDDLVAIIRTGGTLGALQQFTNDRRMIDRALSQVKWNICSRVGISVLPAIGSEQNPGCGMSFSSIINTLRALRFVVEAMGEIPGRKSMVVFSDSLPREEQDFTRGLNRSEDASGGPALMPDNRDLRFLLQRVAEKAIRSSVVIYAVDAGGLQTTGITAADDFSSVSARQMTQTINNTISSRSRLIQLRREGAELIAKETGGFLVRNSNDFQLDRILEDQSGYYLIGYRPTDETFNRKFHHIKAKVKKSGMTLRTRYGFLGVSEEEVDRSKRTPTDKFTIALMSPFGAQDLSVDLNAFFTNDKAGSFIRSLVFLSARDLAFSDAADGWHNALIQLRGVIFGNNGVMVDQATYDRKISLRGDTYEQALREGLIMQFDMPVKRPGAYQVRVAAQDVSTHKVGAVGQFVQIPDLTKHELALSGLLLTVTANTNGSAQTSSGANLVVRRFITGTNLLFACRIYNARIDASSHLPKVAVQFQLFRDGKSVLSGPPITVDASTQTDLERLVAAGTVRLTPDLEPGNYFLELIATDLLVTGKQEPAVQWIDFEIVK